MRIVFTKRAIELIRAAAASGVEELEFGKLRMKFKPIGAVPLPASVTGADASAASRPIYALDHSATAAELGMPEDPGEEVPEDKMPPLEQLYVPLPPRATATMPAPIVRPPDKQEAESVTVELPEGVDKEDEELDRALFMPEQPKTDAAE